jgi:hypothetical protein
MGCGDYLKEQFPGSKLISSEALQCPTLLENGFGGHRIEGIGDKHIPWIHNVKNTDFVVAIDDEDPMHLIRLFNDPIGKKFLRSIGLSEDYVNQLELLGISGVANMLSAIKFAKYYELTGSDVVLTVLTDSMEMYQTRLQELNKEFGPYTPTQAAVDHNRHLLGVKTDAMLELGYRDRKRIHNLKYFTWIEQMGLSVDELDRQWYDYDNYWGSIHGLVPAIDQLIVEFNDAVGLADAG